MAAQYIPIKRISSLDTPIKAEKLDGSLFTTEKQAHEFIISVRKNGVKQTVTGSVSGKFIRANGTTIFLQGSIVDGDAVVRLHQDCYNVQGRFTFNIFNTQSGVTTCIYSAVGKIDMGSTETVIDAGDVVPDVSDVVAAQEAAQAAITAANTAAQTANTAAQNVGSIVARPYSSSSTYTAGDYCTNNGNLYKANQDISTAEEWTASHWTQIVMGDEVTSLKSALNDIGKTFDSGYINIFPYHSEWKNGYFSASGALVANNNNISPTNSPFLVQADTVLHIIPAGLTANIFVYEKSGDTYSRKNISTFTDNRTVTYDVDTWITIHFGGWTHGTDISQIQSVIEKTTTLFDMNQRVNTAEQNIETLESKEIKNENAIDSIKYTFLGVVQKQHVLWSNADTSKSLISFRAKANVVYLFSATVADTVQSYVAFYIERTDNTRITQVYIQADQNKTNTQFSVATDTDCVIKCSPAVADGTIELVEVGIKSETSIVNYFSTKGLIESSVDDKTVFMYGNTIFAANRISLITDGTNDCHIAVNISNCYPGECIHVRANRIDGADDVILCRSFSSDGVSILDSGTYENEIYYIVPNNAVRVSIILMACHGTALASETVVTMEDVLIERYEASGVGFHGYWGDKIILEKPSLSFNRCNISVWRDFKKADEPSIVNYALSFNQSMAIHGNYVFLLNSGGTGIVCNYTTKNIIGTFSYEPTELQHANSAQFTDIWYSDGDAFPLLMVSRCGNAGRLENPEDIDECTFLRITQSGTDFVGTAINSVSFETITYGGNWTYDEINRLIYYTSNDDGNFTQNVPSVFRCFKMPSKTEILSGVKIVLQNSDVVSKFAFDGTNLIGQGSTFKNGRFYYAVQVGASHKATIWVIDPIRGTVVSSVPLESNQEPEGVAFADGKLYVSQKNAADTESVNPLTVWQIEF